MAQDWNTEVYQCRALGHAWDIATPERRPQIGLPLSLRCTRCGTERHDTVAPVTGYVLSRGYLHPDSYTSTPGHPLPTRAEARAFLVEGPRPKRRLRVVEGGRRGKRQVAG